jgi:23S rRNA (cytosine1962-C5)-methyltransferase
MIAAIQLKSGRERPVLQRHPWIYAGSIASVDGSPASGETVEVLDSQGRWLARGAYSPASQIRIRIWTWRSEELVTSDMLGTRLREALEWRRGAFDPDEINAYREINAEADGLPGLIVDRYGSLRVIQVLSAGAEYWLEALLPQLADEDGIEAVLERSDTDVRQLEGLPKRVRWLRGGGDRQLWQIYESPMHFEVDVVEGHKTGFYLDQRESRRRILDDRLAGELLNCFAYTGGFSVAALLGGASRVIAVDSSAAAIELGKKNMALNRLPQADCEWIEGDVFAYLRRLRDQDRKFDSIVLDPPRFAPTSAQVQRAARGYKDINLLALKLLRPGGRLYTFSCSGGVSPDLFQKIVAGAALDAGVEMQIIAWLNQPADHAVRLNFPEGRYLKGLIGRVLG